MMLPKAVLLILLSFFLVDQEGFENRYHRDFHNGGKIKSEGWLTNKKKTGYWKFYHTNGQLSGQGTYENDRREKYWFFYDQNNVRTKEGHYSEGTMQGWWLFYDSEGRINHKCQLRNGQKNGYCLKYHDEKLASAEKYKAGKKIKEWHSFANFKRENSLSNLR